MALEDEALPRGTYEMPITRRVRDRMVSTRQVDPAVNFGTIDGGDSSARSRYISALSHQVARRLVQHLKNSHDPEQRVDLINRIAELLDSEDSIEGEQLLYSVYGPPVLDPPPLPEVSLNTAHLMTNARGEPNFAHELRRELRTADSVDLLCAFIKNSGISVIHNELLDLKQRGIPLRVITSTYCGATDAEAIERLVDAYGATVHVGYEGRTTRLHAKAWLFRRKSGFDTAFIGSSNLSNSALIDGIEWNVRTSSTLTPAILEKFTATFDTYWNDNHFGPFDPSKDLPTLEAALNEAKTMGTGSKMIEISSLDVRPYPHQEVMLEALEAQREVHDRHQNLLIAATGTGKTVVAALDYRNLTRANDNNPPRLLFVAHRREILEQSLRTYREVLRRSDFGELLTGNHQPKKWQHVFASIQSLNAQRLARIEPDHFDVVVIDEFHHAEAASYRRLLNHLQPKELLGLTATPERGDGVNVAEFFDYRVAYELRLWDALHQQLLAPMHYYGVNDDTDISGVTWRGGDYDLAELGELYVRAGMRRVRAIISAIQQRIFNLDAMKALGFCVSVKHSEFMAQAFNELGIPAASVTGQTPTPDCDAALRDLRSGDIKAIFSVDVFNEGVDIPETNTVLLLRPTQSPTIFIQQIGRGLRLSEGKDVCTVFDFIGQQHKDFDFHDKYAALTGRRGQRLVEALENDFPQLPPGSSIELDRQAQDLVLKNVKRVSRSTLTKIRSLIKQEGTTSLPGFLQATGIPIEDIYRSNGSSWTKLLRDAGLVEAPPHPDETEELLLRSIRKFLHINDSARADAYKKLSSQAGLEFDSLDETDQAFARMFTLMIWANMGKSTPDDYQEALQVIRRYPTFHEELRQLIDIQKEASRRLVEKMPPRIGHGALYSHADYSRAELVGALEKRPLTEAVHLFREGVYHIKEYELDLFLVTLDKDDDSFSATTSYKDYPIDTDLFHWESQSHTSLSSETGQRYIHHQERGHDIVLAVRAKRLDAINMAAAFTLLGTVNYVNHRGEKPIQFEWKLDRAMPNGLYLQGRAVV